jgi:hypothetical protein
MATFLNYNQSDLGWIIWEKQQRGRSLSKALDIPYFEILSKYKGLFRYFDSIVRTLLVIMRMKPKVLIVTNPSIILNSFALFLKLFFRYSLIVDFHNAGLFPSEGKSYLLQKFANYLVRNADIALITNFELEKYVKNIGGSPIVIPDPLPNLQVDKKVANSYTTPEFFNILLIRGGGKDEPIDIINDLIEEISKKTYFKLFITGKDKGQFYTSNNVVKTGYLNEAQYNTLFSEIDVAIVLSDRKDNLMCGAYEAVSLEKPFIASDSKVIRWYFKKGVYYSSNNANDLFKGIEKIREDYNLFSKEISELKMIISNQWPLYGSKLLDDINTKLIHYK